MGKQKKKKHGGKKAVIPSGVKTFLTMLVGGVVGEILSPVLPAAVSGAGVGIAVAGLLTRGVSARVLPYVVAAGAVQGVQTLSRTKPVLIARASVSGASRALTAGGGASVAGESDALAKARAAVGG